MDMKTAGGPLTPDGLWIIGDSICYGTKFGGNHAFAFGKFAPKKFILSVPSQVFEV